MLLCTDVSCLICYPHTFVIIWLTVLTKQYHENNLLCKEPAVVLTHTLKINFSNRPTTLRLIFCILHHLAMFINWTKRVKLGPRRRTISFHMPTDPLASGQDILPVEAVLKATSDKPITFYRYCQCLGPTVNKPFFPCTILHLSFEWCLNGKLRPRSICFWIFFHCLDRYVWILKHNKDLDEPTDWHARHFKVNFRIFLTGEYWMLAPVALE